MQHLIPHATTLAALVLLAVACSKNDDAAPTVGTSNGNIEVVE